MLMCDPRSIVVLNTMKLNITNIQYVTHHHIVSAPDLMKAFSSVGCSLYLKIINEKLVVIWHL